MHSPEFESGIIKLCKSNYSLEDLSVRERAALERFRTTCDDESQSELDDDASSSGPVVFRAAKRRRLNTNEQLYHPVSWIPPTSNSVERFFSRCKQVFTDFRQRLTPLNLEMQLYLKMHEDLWINDPTMVCHAIKVQEK